MKRSKWRDGSNSKKKEGATVSSLNHGSSSLPVLRSFETVDFEALTKGFDSEEVKEGKLVLYITEAQLLQLLKQRAIIIPDSPNSANEASSIHWITNLIEFTKKVYLRNKSVKLLGIGFGAQIIA